MGCQNNSVNGPDTGKNSGGRRIIKKYLRCSKREIKEILCLVGLQRGHFDFLPLLCQVGNCFRKK